MHTNRVKSLETRRKLMPCIAASMVEEWEKIFNALTKTLETFFDENNKFKELNNCMHNSTV